MGDPTRDQIAAVMLAKGTPDQQIEALEYCGLDVGAKGELIKLAADLVRGKNLTPLYALCENQQTVSTRKLGRAVEELHDREKLVAMSLRQIADKM